MLISFFRGILTGMLLQLAIGPVFMFIINTVFQYGKVNGIAAVTGVTTADYIYICMAVAGLGILFKNEKLKKQMALISSVILILFGIGILLKETGVTENIRLTVKNSLMNSYLAAFFLTISSPLTIIFWTGVFSVKAEQYKMKFKELLCFAAGAGAATFVFLSLSVLILSFVKDGISNSVLYVINSIAGGIIIFFGVRGIVMQFKDKTKGEKN